MRVTIKTKNGNPSADLSLHVEKRAKKLERYFHVVDTVEVVQSTERGQHVAEITIHGDAIVMRSQERCGEAVAALEGAIDKLESQILRFRSRVRDDHRRANPVKDFVGSPEQATPDADDDALPRITRRKRHLVKPMPPEEAAMQMELLGHDFYLFRNDATEELNVLYRRHDGNYGLIEPEG